MAYGTVVVVEHGESIEVTTFRGDGRYSDNRRPDEVRFVSSIIEDLARRDFTMNAVAWSPTRGLVDPYGGQHDIRSGVIRAVGDAHERFQEDALRMLRAARFASRYGFRLDEETFSAMAAHADKVVNENEGDDQKTLPEHAFLCYNRNHQETTLWRAAYSMLGSFSLSDLKNTSDLATAEL